MDASGTHSANRDYYDSFSRQYEKHRGSNDPGGYHELLDELESDFVKRFGAGRHVLEVGCGTGLVLSRIDAFAQSAKGVDLSPGMLDKARQRGLDVVEGSATDLPFADATFDVTCSFKVLAHVPDIEKALSEMARVTRPGGHVIAEFYNPFSFRGLVKRLTPPRAIAQNAHEGQVFTRFDSPRRARELAPRGCEYQCSRGIRIFTPTAMAMRVPGLRRAFWLAETRLCDSPARFFGGFYAVAYRKLG
jgi:ubiquinone/menaquinone biosynthesis C-methylase UbiE